MPQNPYQPRPRLATLSPAYFSMAMATGIISIGAWRLGFPQLARILFGINLCIYAVLWVLYVIRMARYCARFIGDLCDHVHGMGYFTVVATQAVATLSALIAAHAGHPFVLELNFMVLSMWLWGGIVCRPAARVVAPRPYAGRRLSRTRARGSETHIMPVSSLASSDIIE